MMGRARKPAFWTALMGSVLSNEEAPPLRPSRLFFIVFLFCMLCLLRLTPKTPPSQLRVVRDLPMLCHTHTGSNVKDANGIYCEAPPSAEPMPRDTLLLLLPTGPMS